MVLCVFFSKTLNDGTSIQQFLKTRLQTSFCEMPSFKNLFKGENNEYFIYQGKTTLRCLQHTL